MTLDCRHFEGDWEMLALGALDPAREQELRAHLETGCPYCARSFAEAAALTRSLASTVATARPSPGVARSLETRIRQSESPRPARPALVWLAMAAALVLSAGLGFYFSRTQLTPELAQLRARVAELEGRSPVTVTREAPPREVIREVPKEVVREVTREVTREVPVPREVIREVPREVVREVIKEVPVEVKVPGPVRVEKDPLVVAELERAQAQLAEYRRIFRALEGSAIRQVDLKVVDSGGGRATARALLSPDGGLLLFARDLPRLPGKKCYQLWLVHNAAPAITSAGLLQVDEAGRGILVAPPGVNLRDVTGLAITDEPEGGSVSSRGRKLLFGAL